MCLVLTYELEFTISFVTNALYFELSICSISMNESDCELSANVFLTEISTSPVLVDASGYEQSVCTNVALEPDVELSFLF